MPTPNLAKKDQPQPVSQAFVLAKAVLRSFKRYHSARNKPSRRSDYSDKGSEEYADNDPCHECPNDRTPGYIFIAHVFGDDDVVQNVADPT